MRLVMSNSLAKTFHSSTLLNALGSYSNKFGVFTKLFHSDLKPFIPYNFTLEKGEVFRVPAECRELYVRSGIAWITVDGKDIILTTGEKASLESNQGSAVISALGKMPLRLEVL